jgi:hypothetical protein
MSPNYTPTVWTDDDGSGTTGTIYGATVMRNIENQLDLVSDLFIAFRATLATDAILPGAPALAAGVLTASGNAALNVDSASAASGDLILVKDEVNQIRNGLYIVNNAGAAGAKFVLSRVPYQDAQGEIQAAELVSIEKGLANADSLWNLISDGGTTFTPDKTPLAFSRAIPEAKEVHNVEYATSQPLPANARTNNTLTANANATLSLNTIDAPVVGDRILVKDEVPNKHNGIYIVTSIGSGATKWTLERASDFKADADVISECFVQVSGGSINWNTIWKLATDGPFTLNTTALTFARVEPRETDIAHDASTASPNFSGGTQTFKHTPLAGNPRGILVLIAQESVTSPADEITSVTYGGVAMTEIALSPFSFTSGVDDGMIYGYFLGSGIPAGAQNVVVTATGKTLKRAVAVSMTGPDDLLVTDTTTLDTSTGTPSVSLSTATGVPAIIYGMLCIDSTSLDLIAADSNSVELYKGNGPLAAGQTSVARAITNSTGGNKSVGWSTAVKTCAVLGVAISSVKDVRPACRAFNSANISTTTAVTKTLTFDSERRDNASMHDTSVNPSRITAPIAGMYLVTGHIQWTDNAAGRRLIAIKLNGGTYYAIDDHLSSSVSQHNSISTVLFLNAGDYVELDVAQSSGGNLNVETVAAYSPEFAAAYLGPG